ncbi:Transposase [Rubripirellula lacrimiformis]|uniref:Transposase n=1 Tax=Rubripirellula lacrimiformis TaxID=1930273 RepID=A0A517NHB1_9BACT|nr:IS110 family transposase [Rubripirellula lacrimiformis]QDT06531.1 Transposase [Rubripirellula lacrimiformis]
MNDNPSVLIGIDWADKKHDYHLIGPDGKSHTGIFLQSPEAIEEMVQKWRKVAGGAPLAIAIEATKGPLINALMQFGNIEIYPINPAAMASYRKAFSHGGSKNDPVDCQLLVQYLSNYIDQLEPLRQDQPLTRQIASLVEERRHLVDRRADLGNELVSVLKMYFPAILALKAAKSYAGFLLALVAKYPTLEATKKAGANKLRRFFNARGLRKHAESRIETLLTSRALSDDETLLQTCSRRAVNLCEQLQLLNKLIKRAEDELKCLIPRHPDHAIAESFPEAAVVTQARMIMAMGDDRSRFPTAESLSACSGIAPVTIQSGRMKIVRRRWACPKFMKQTFHEYAAQSVKGGGWAKAYYDLQISRGKPAQVAFRALAFKWQRVIHRCWLSGQPYCESTYVERLRATGSPVVALLDQSIPKAA